MNYRLIIIFSVVLTVVGVLSTALVAVVVFRAYEPNEVNSSILSYLTLLTGFVVDLIGYVLLPFFHKDMPYKHAAMVAVLCWIYTLSAEYIIGTLNYLPIHELILSKIIPIILTVAAVLLGTEIGIKIRRNSENRLKRSQITN